MPRTMPTASTQALADGWRRLKLNLIVFSSLEMALKLVALVAAVTVPVVLAASICHCASLSATKSSADSEWDGGARPVPFDRHQTAGVTHIEKLPSELVDRVLERLQL